MHLVCDAATLRGDRATNQDRVVVVDGAVAVLDGATSWLRPADDPRDGGWYAGVLGQALSARLPGSGRPLAEIMGAAICDVRDAHDLVPGESPYSTATLVRWDDDVVDVLVLGDSPVVVQRPTGQVAVVADERLAATASAERAAYREHLQRGHGFDARFADLIAAVQRVERQSFNVNAGFWVAEADPRAAEHAVVRAFPTSEVESISLMSDGVSAAVTDYGLMPWSAVPGHLARSGAGRLVEQVHATELSDPDGRRWPRTKRHDDKTVAFLRRLRP